MAAVSLRPTLEEEEGAPHLAPLNSGAPLWGREGRLGWPLLRERHPGGGWAGGPRACVDWGLGHPRPPWCFLAQKTKGRLEVPTSVARRGWGGGWRAQGCVFQGSVFAAPAQLLTPPFLALCWQGLCIAPK